MSGFSAEWLALREPFDAAARSAALVAELRAHLAPGTDAAPLEVVDLGAGAGSNLRYLVPLLGGAQRWRLVDHDAALLAAALAATRSWAEARGARVTEREGELTIRADDLLCHVRCAQRDLSATGALALRGATLVTAAALLDLVSDRWLAALAAACRDTRAAVYFALTYDGRTACTPPDAGDREALALFNRHQLGDKGFGPALGPNAASAAQRAFAATGYRLAAQSSDWQMLPADRAMQHALLDGWLGAALEAAPDRRDPLTAWHARRAAHVTAGRSELRVGHIDFAGWLDA